MPDGITIAAFAVLVALLYLWATRDRIDRRRDLVEDEHARRRRVHTTIDRFLEADYREQLRVDLRNQQHDMVERVAA